MNQAERERKVRRIRNWISSLSQELDLAENAHYHGHEDADEMLDDLYEELTNVFTSASDNTDDL